ncbi:MAG: hypothetical protein FWC08_13855, partial [Defluviitaleaceae bacterium]|nr:hypothetical protein [Defluviitaleaceae bacterium]
MRDKIKKALHYIAERHGVALFSEPAKFKATLADTLGNMGVGGSEANRLRHLLNTAVGDMQAYSRLKNAFARKEYIAVAHLIAEMDRDYDVKTDSAQIVIECIAELLGYAPPAPAVREEPHPRERQQSPAPFEPSRQPSERQHPRPASPQPDSAPAQLSDADILRLAAALKNDVSLQSVIGQANPLSLASPVIARIKEVLPSIPAVFQQKPPLPAAKNSLIRETKKFAGCDWLVL